MFVSSLPSPVFHVLDGTTSKRVAKPKVMEHENVNSSAPTSLETTCRTTIRCRFGGMAGRLPVCVSPLKIVDHVFELGQPYRTGER